MKKFYLILSICIISICNVLVLEGRAIPEPLQPMEPEIQPRSGEPLKDLTSQEMALFSSGRKAFLRVFTPPDGLGPIFNGESCAECHGSPGDLGFPPIGGASAGLSESVIRFGLLSDHNFDSLFDLGGSLLQKHSVSSLDQCIEQVPIESNVSATRIATPIFGAGLVEAIPDNDILIGENSNTVSGKANLVKALEDPESSQARVGRFGWKAQIATILSFSASASRDEIGITNQLLPNENAPQGNQSALAQCDKVQDPEDSSKLSNSSFVDSISNFQRFLAPPPQTPKSGMSGETLFNEVGCNACHKSTFTTSNDEGLPRALKSKTIKPYSDYLLHDMGEAGDGIEQDGAKRFEMRTAPLWGIRNRPFLWHDGSIYLADLAALDKIILGSINPTNQKLVGHSAKGSESATTARAYGKLSLSKRMAIFDFLRSLGRAEFDLTDSSPVSRVDHFDIEPMISCLQLEEPISADDACAVADLDSNGIINSFDIAGFVLAYQDPQFDCNCDDESDLLQILENSVKDIDSDGYPDSCHAKLTLSIVPAKSLANEEQLELDQEVLVVVSAAKPESSIYLFVSFEDQPGTSSGLLPGSLADECVNLSKAVNLLTVLGLPDSIKANSFGAASLKIIFPKDKAFSKGGKLAVQAFAINEDLSLMRSAPISKELY